MGVNGLFGFLQKTFPGVVNRIPDRFQNFSGKTVVFDATLITQRFHFAPSPHQYRHVLGWYRLVLELRRHNVNSICVFDGKERSAAKAVEAERRRLTRKLVAARANKESERLARLRKLQKVIKSIPTVTTSPTNVLDAQQEEQPVNQNVTCQADITVGDGSESLPSRKSARTATPLGDPPPFVPSQHIPSARATSPTNVLDSQHEEQPVDQNVTCQTDITTGGDSETLPSCKSAMTATPLGDPPTFVPSQHVPSTSPPESPSEEPVLQDPDRRRKQCEDRPSGHITRQTAPTLASTDDNSSLEKSDLKILAPVKTEVKSQQEELSELYQDYQSSRSKPESGAAYAKEDALDSKSQMLLNHDEDLLWKSVLSKDSPSSRGVSNLLENLTERSQQLSDSYERRHPPSRLTYEQSRSILEALGVPCIVCQGAFEAEALASSLVHHRIADYVASEDTDVIVYDAPLLRNIASRQGELVCVSGEGVREALMLSQPSFVDFALLIGTDFTQRLRGLGPKRALQFISTHGSIEAVLQHQPQYAPPTAWTKRLYLRQIGRAREVFASLPSVPDAAVLEPRATDEERVMELLARFELVRAAIDEDWDPQNALVGNYFDDDPTSSIVDDGMPHEQDSDTFFK